MSTGLTDEVLASFAATPDERLRTILERVVVHLHELVREVRPTVAEWESAIGFLTAVGAMCDDTRQEFILLSDVLGVSSLVETLNGSTVESGGTESTVLGPFHMTSSPARELGDSIDDVGGGRRALVTGRVVDPSGRAVPGAEIDVWQCTEDGFYDVQQPAAPGDLEARGEALQGAWLCGAVLGATTMSLHHKLCHVLGGSFDLPHAETHAVVLPHVVAHNGPGAPAAMAALGRALGVGSSPGTDPETVTTALAARARDLGAPTSLAALGMPSDGLPRVVEQVLAAPYANPAPVTRESLTALLEAAF